MAESWVRLWSGMTTDPKWQTVARKSGQPRSLVIALFTHLMLEANDADERGSLADVDVEDVASALDCDEEAVVAILEAMEGRVIEDGFLSGWDRRQPVREDSGNPQTGALSSTERSRLHREKKRLETQCNARNDDATRCNAPEAEADTEADIPPTPPARDGDFRMDLDKFRPVGIARPADPAQQAAVRVGWVSHAASACASGEHSRLPLSMCQRSRSASLPMTCCCMPRFRPASHSVWSFRAQALWS